MEDSLPIKVESELIPEIKSTVYNWDTGAPYMVNKRQKVIVDSLLEKEDFKYIRSRVKDEVGLELSVADIRKELEYPNVFEYLSARIEEKGIASGLTLDAYIAMGYRVMRGEVVWKPEQVMVWKQLAKVRGFEAGTGTNIVNSIQITQLNGEK